MRALSIAEARQEVTNGIGMHKYLERLPAGLGHTWKLTAVCKLAEADATEFEVTHIAVLATAAPAAANNARRVLWRALRFGDLGFSCHRISL